MTITMFWDEGPIATASAMAISSVGKARKMSTSRIRIESSQPPK